VSNESTDYLAGVMASIDEAYTQAEAEVAEARQRLEEAERKFETVKALKAVKDGKGLPGKRLAPSSPVSRASRADGLALQDRIISALGEAGSDGLSFAELLERVVPGADAKGQQRIRYQLSVMAKAKTIVRGESGSYTLS
jgi:hypothetical protein